MIYRVVPITTKCLNHTDTHTHTHTHTLFLISSLLMFYPKRLETSSPIMFYPCAMQEDLIADPF